MVYRTSFNNEFSTYPYGQPIFYFLYNFMTTASPNGPGWVSVGEGNGVDQGGMGVTGIISTTPPQNSWFVLQSPDGLRQICFKLTFVYQFGFYYNPIADWEGGDATTIPTTSLTDTGLCGLYTFSQDSYLNILADDEYPYNFYCIHVQLGSVANVLVMSALQTFSSDPDPYVILYTNNGFSSIVTKCWNQDHFPDIFALKWEISNGGGTTIFPNNAPTTPDGEIIVLPIFYGSINNETAGIFKGVGDFANWASGGGELNFLDDKSKILINGIALPWDGNTVPLY